MSATKSVDPRAILAASNNADLYHAIFDAHGLRHTRLPHAFVGQDAPPPYYSNLTILTPDRQDACRAELAKLADSFAGRLGLKDSFCQMELAANGFETLFAASWIWRAPHEQAAPHNWHQIRSPDQLFAWEDAWKSSGSPTPSRMFPPQMLERDDIVFLGRQSGGEFQSGCIANHSADCIGISNVFAVTPTPDTFAEAARAVAHLAPDKPIVGYESGADLNAARAAGFTSTGALRILFAECATF